MGREEASAMPALLLFNIPPQKRAALQVIALRCGCRMQLVPAEKHSAALGQLLSGEAEQSAPAEPFTGEMLVMAGLHERQLDTVLTPTNAGWTPRELYGELCREREAIGRGGQAHE